MEITSQALELEILRMDPWMGSRKYVLIQNNLFLLGLLRAFGYFEQSFCHLPIHQAILGLQLYVSEWIDLNFFSNQNLVFRCNGWLVILIMFHICSEGFVKGSLKMSLLRSIPCCSLLPVSPSHSCSKTC